MKRIKMIAKEVQKVVKCEAPYILERTKDWKYYISIFGLYNGEYYSIDFMKSELESEPLIRIAHTTENPHFFIDMIKKIEPLIKIEHRTVKDIIEIKIY